MYNNVASLGHVHPIVTQALVKQAQVCDENKTISRLYFTFAKDALHQHAIFDRGKCCLCRKIAQDAETRNWAGHCENFVVFIVLFFVVLFYFRVFRSFSSTVEVKRMI